MGELLTEVECDPLDLLVRLRQLVVLDWRDGNGLSADTAPLLLLSLVQSQEWGHVRTPGVDCFASAST